jgi:hypothetical protein
MQPRVCLSSSTFVSFSKASLSNTRTWPLDDEAAHAGIRDELQLIPVGRSKSPGYGHLKLPHLMIAVSAAEQQ